MRGGWGARLYCVAMSQPAAPISSPDTASADLSAWQPFFVAGEYRRALAAARLQRSAGEGSPEVLDTLEALFDLQEALRARRYDQAQERLSALEEALGRCPAPDAATLHAQLDPQKLRPALAALQGVPGPGQARFSVQQLETQVQPALQEALTRAEAHNLLGVAQAQAGQVAAAKAHFEAAREADPQHHRAVSNLGNMALEEGRLDEAEALQRQAIALNGDFASAHHNLGVVLRQQGKLAQSVGHIKRGQRLSQRQALQERPEGLPRWLTPQSMRLLGLVLAALVFFALLRGHY